MRLVPRGRVRDAVDVVPAAGVEPDEVRPERRANLHQLERGFELLDEHVDLDRVGRQAEMTLQRVEHVAPQRRLFGRLDLRQIEDDAPALATKHGVIVRDVEREIDDGGGERLARDETHVTVVQMQAARAEDARGEIELLAPVVDDGAAEEAAGPLVDLPCHALGDGHEHAVSRIRQLQVALVVERHALDLALRVFPIEHPAIGARQQCVGDVADAFSGRRARPRRGTGALDPLALKVGRNVAAVEASRAGVADEDVRAADRGVGWQERDGLALALAAQTPLDARRASVDGASHRTARARPSPRARRA